MKINFYCGKITSVEIAKHKSTTHSTWTYCEDFSAIMKSDKYAISKELYSDLLLLSKSTLFENFISIIRDYFNLPKTGYTYEEYKNLSKKGKKIQERPIKEYIKKNITAYIHNLNPLLYNSLSTIAICDGVFLPIRKISIDAPGVMNSEIDDIGITISIHQSITNTELNNYLNQYWDVIEKSMKFLDYYRKKSVFVSERDIEIYELRANSERLGQKLKFRIIADYLAEKYNDYNINEDLVKTCYRRAQIQLDTIINGK